MGEEQWLDPDADNPDGEWRSYLELPEYLELAKQLPVMKPHNPKKYVTRKGQW
jgi:hypothetical protein